VSVNASIALRPASALDLDAIVEVERSADEAFLATEHANAPDLPPMAPDVYLRLISDGTVWVAQLDDALVGSLVAEVTQDALHLWELAVRFSYQRQGVGRRLAQTAVAAAIARRLPAVTLTTFRGVVFNAPFYRTLGFASLDRPPSRLRAILQAETECGLRDRCAMRLTLPGKEIH
jgi:GNAT superfamily N-acetyltransferase